MPTYLIRERVFSRITCVKTKVPLFEFAPLSLTLKETLLYLVVSCFTSVKFEVVLVIFVDQVAVLTAHGSLAVMSYTLRIVYFEKAYS